MKISIDLHGTLDKDPKGFSEYIDELAHDGHQVYILTGSTYTDAISELAELKLNLGNITEIKSVTDYLLKKQIPWENDKHGRPIFDESVWYGAKAAIARSEGFDLHIDDCIKFEKTFTTPFLLYEG